MKERVEWERGKGGKGVINGKIFRMSLKRIYCKGIESLKQNQIFKLTISLEPDVVNLWYFKLRLFDLTELIVWNMLGPQNLFPKI